MSANEESSSIKNIQESQSQTIQKIDETENKLEELHSLFQKALQFKQENHLNFAILEFLQVLDAIKDDATIDPKKEIFYKCHTELVCCYYLAEEYTDCVQTAKSILLSELQNPQVLYYLGMSLIKIGDTKQGIDYLKQAQQIQTLEEEYLPSIQKEIDEYETEEKQKEAKGEEQKVVQHIEEPKKEILEDKPEKVEKKETKTESRLATIIGSALGSGICGFGIAKFVFGVSEKKGAIAGLAVSLLTGGLSWMLQN